MNVKTEGSPVDLGLPRELRAPVVICCTREQLDALLYVMSVGMTTVRHAVSINPALVPSNMRMAFEKAFQYAPIADAVGSALSQGIKLAEGQPERVQIHRLVEMDPNAAAAMAQIATVTEVALNAFSGNGNEPMIPAGHEPDVTVEFETDMGKEPKE